MERGVLLTAAKIALAMCGADERPEIVAKLVWWSAAATSLLMAIICFTKTPRDLVIAGAAAVVFVALCALHGPIQQGLERVFSFLKGRANA